MVIPLAIVLSSQAIIGFSADTDFEHSVFNRPKGEYPFTKLWFHVGKSKALVCELLLGGTSEGIKSKALLWLAGGGEDFRFKRSGGHYVVYGRTDDEVGEYGKGDGYGPWEIFETFDNHGRSIEPLSFQTIKGSYAKLAGKNLRLITLLANRIPQVRIETFAGNSTDHLDSRHALFSRTENLSTLNAHQGKYVMYATNETLRFRTEGGQILLNFQSKNGLIKNLRRLPWKIEPTSPVATPPIR